MLFLELASLLNFAAYLNVHPTSCVVLKNSLKIRWISKWFQRHDSRINSRFLELLFHLLIINCTLRQSFLGRIFLTSEKKVKDEAVYSRLDYQYCSLLLRQKESRGKVRPFKTSRDVNYIILDRKKSTTVKQAPHSFQRMFTRIKDNARKTSGF